MGCFLLQEWLADFTIGGSTVCNTNGNGGTSGI